MSSAHRLLALLFVAAAGALLAASHPGAPAARADDPLEVTVTSAADGEATAAGCADPATCTLRAAILQVNADTSPGAYTIRFSAEAFPAGAPVTIAVAATPLPPITRANTVVDATDRGVVVDGSELDGEADGLVVEGDGGEVRALAIRSFERNCFALHGAGASATATITGGCDTGILVTGGGTLRDNHVGFDRDGAPLTVATGIRVTTAPAIVGAEAGATAGGNTIGNAGTAIAVGDVASSAAVGGTSVAANTIGRSPGGAPAPASIGIQLLPPSAATTVRANDIANTSIAGIQVVAGSAEPGVVRNRLATNRFEIAAGMAIDLGADAIRNPNDANDADSGPNQLQNHPQFTRPTQSAITGVVPGCDTCEVELYMAHHEPGGANDYGREPIPIARAVTDASGNFSFVAPPVLPGAWVTATATDAEGNTSEFGPSARVGGGSAQCGNLTLEPGWNLAGYFYPTPLTLGASFPANGGVVSAIYHLADGAGTYTHWFAGTAVSRTLTTLLPGESYWFYATAETTLPAGFALAVPVPVQLQPGWNDFVYIGGEGDIRDAFASIAGKYTTAYRYDAATQAWEQYAGPDVPGWVHDFATVEPCTAYFVHMDEAGTLLPLQP
ncbi:MAG: hypothetical protein IT303_12865 [Dehalococcoidia bacterium]|nr:hypothetical protein [Dehalococcoidia bacterium]